MHGFPVGLIQCESNLLGITSTRGLSVGSGGWTNVVEKYAKAKAFCERPFEIRHDGGRKVKVAIPGEWIGGTSHDRPEHRSIVIRCADSAQCQLEPDSLDAVLTDPPYFRSVQYAELMDFCYVWLRRLIDNGDDCFSKSSTRDPAELTGNDNMNRGLEHFTDGLSAVFQKMAIALKATAPLAFTYHNNKLDAYYPVAVALLDAGFVCTLSIPCPAEMGASIHINGTGSSIIDTIFVCRKDSTLSSKSDLTSLRESFHNDQSALRKAGVKPTAGDLRCIAYGHLTRYAVQHL